MRRLLEARPISRELWLAVLEDELRKVIPETSQVFLKFIKLKDAAEDPQGATVDPRIEIAQLVDATYSQIENVVLWVFD